MRGVIHIPLLAALTSLAAGPLAAQTTVAAGERVRGTLGAGDARMDGEVSPYFDAYVVQGRPGGRIKVVMKSRDMMPALHWGRYEDGVWTEVEAELGEHSNIDSERVVTLDGVGRWELRAAGRFASEEGAYSLRLSDLALAAGVRIAPGQRVEGDITASDFEGEWGSEDHYVITGAPGQVITVCAASYDFDAELRFGTWADGRFTQIAEEGSGGMGGDPWMTVRMEQGGEHHLLVHKFLGDSTGGEYILRVMEGAVGADVDPQERGCEEGGRADFDEPRGAWRDAVEPIEADAPTTRALGPDSDRDASGAWYREFSYPARAGARITVLAASAEFDPSLSIGTGRGAEFTSLETGLSENGEALLIFTPERDGEHVIRVSAPGDGRPGWFVVEVTAPPAPDAAPGDSPRR